MVEELTIDWQESANLLPKISSMHALKQGVSDAYVPVRDLRQRRNARSVTGEINSIRGPVSHVFESIGEKRHTIIADAQYEVARLQTQPETFMLANSLRYTPDALVWMRDGRKIYREIKPTHWLRDDPTLKDKIQLIADACAARGASFEIISDLWYNAKPRLQNAMWLRRTVKRAEPSQLRKIEDYLAETGGMNAAEIKRLFGAPGVFAAFGLAALHRCKLDLMQPFDDETYFQLVSA